MFLHVLDHAKQPAKRLRLNLVFRKPLANHRHGREKLRTETIRLRRKHVSISSQREISAN